MTTKFEVWCGSLRLINRAVGYTTTMDVRRVDTSNDGEHVQLAVTVEKHHATRTTSEHGYIQLTPEQVPLLITALTKLHPKHDPNRGYQPYGNKDNDDRAFYGLPSA